MPESNKQFRPTIKIDGAAHDATAIRLVWRPGHPGQATVTWTDPKASIPAHGAKVSIADPAGSEIFQGLTTQRSSRSTPAQRSFSITARQAGAKLECPRSECIANVGCGAALNHFVKAAGVTLRGSGGADQHEQVVLLRTRTLDLCHRLALLSGRALLFDVSGAVLVDPAAGSSAKTVKQYNRFDIDLPSPRAVQAIGRDPVDFGKPNVVVAGTGDSALPLILGDAASAGEVSSAAKAAAMMFSAADFRLAGGPDLLNLQPGHWLTAPIDADPLLVAGRMVSWSADAGWNVQLWGGSSSFTHLLRHDASPRLEAAKIISYDEKSGLLVQLLDHPGVQIRARVRADTASKSRLALAIPAPDEIGFVAVSDGHTRAAYLGSAVPAGVLNTDDFGKLVSVVRAGQFQRTFAKDGVEAVKIQSSDYHVEGASTSKAKTFDFDEA